MNEGEQRSQYAREALKRTLTSSEQAMQRIRQVEQSSLLDREFARFKLQHTDRRETKGMG